MSKATDRFPSDLQWELLISLFPWLTSVEQEFKDLILRPQVTYISNDGTKRVTKYSIGSPMGILTSWASFALCHHLLVRIAGKRVHVRTKGRFLILGDDIVIRGKKLANSYKSLLRQLEIDFSEADSFSSTQGKSVAEFAKRLFVNGQEISPLPLRLIDNNLISDEAAFLVRCNEIRHQFTVESVTYPGTSNRLETLFLCVYLFRAIRNKLQLEPTCTREYASVIDSQLADVFKEYFGTQIGSARELLIGYKPQGEITVQYFLRILFGRNNRKVLSVNDGLLQMVCHYSS